LGYVPLGIANCWRGQIRPAGWTMPPWLMVDAALTDGCREYGVMARLHAVLSKAYPASKATRAASACGQARGCVGIAHAPVGVCIECAWMDTCRSTRLALPFLHCIGARARWHNGMCAGAPQLPPCEARRGAAPQHVCLLATSIGAGADAAVHPAAQTCEGG
jgi:hypothetical protein